MYFYHVTIMTLKLGELLLREKLVTLDQLDDALTKHALYGIKLGSSLVEMGYVEEDRLSQLLSEKLGVQRVGSREVLAAEQEALHKLTKEQAARYRVIPFRLERNNLSIAMSDPTNITAIQEIEFITGSSIKTYIAPDIMISKALAKLYHLSSSRISYQQVSPRAKKSQSRILPPTVTFPMTSASGELINVTVPAEFEGFGNLPDLPEETGVVTAPTQNQVLEENPERCTIEQLSVILAAADTREDVANAIVRYLGREFSYCAIFDIRGRTATGWRGVSLGTYLHEFNRLVIPLNKPSVLQSVVQSGNYVLETLQENTHNRKILSQMKISQPKELLVMPVIVSHEVVSVVVVSVDKETFKWRMIELGKLARMMALAFEKIAITNKLLMMSTASS
jgi:hypothetical protein